MSNSRPLPLDRPPYADRIWQAPLVPVALAATAGIVLDRFASVPLGISLVAAAGFLTAWAMVRTGRQRGLALAYLLGAVAALGAAYHDCYRNSYPADDIGRFADEQPRLARLSGMVADEPITVRQPDEPLRSRPRSDSTHAVLEVTGIKDGQRWLPASGKVRLEASIPLTQLHAGDRIKITGFLMAPQGPANPGEFDFRSYLLDSRIRAVLIVRKSPDAITVEDWSLTLAGLLAGIRGWGQRQLEDNLPEQHSGVAMALILGQGSTMTYADWDQYTRTGVIHVLAISGQQLVVLAFLVWFVLRLFGLRRRQGAVFVALFLIGYAMLVGGRPPVVRSAVMIAVACLGLVLRRPVLTANSLALGWLVVAICNPTDLFTAGCQLSFLAIAILCWGASRLRFEPTDPLAQLAEESRPLLIRGLRRLTRAIGLTYVICLAIWLAAAPLVADRYHLMSPVGILIGPPVTLLSSVALLAGFLLLIASAVCWPLVPVFAFLTRWSLASCNGLVQLADGLPGGHWYVGDLPGWWLAAFYAGLLAYLMVQPVQRRWRWLLPAAVAWVGVGMLVWTLPFSRQEFRCTFLSVGHGGCTVLELPNGKVMLYDAGTLGGPEVTARQIAPYLWSRGIHRIDLVLLSHADTDHFNGLAALAERFSIKQVCCTPFFHEKPTREVAVTLRALRDQGIPLDTMIAGQAWTEGEVELEVLHPPAERPPGNENARSLVLLVRHQGRTILLTGDLEGAGLSRVLGMPAPRIDVMMAPHHGSKTSNTPALATWAKPSVVIACDTPQLGQQPPRHPYQDARFLGTWPHGAVTIRSSSSGLLIETYQTGLQFMVQPAK